MQPEQDEDALLMARFVETRSRSLFGQLFQRYKVLVVQHATRFVKNPARAEELAQDVFVRVYTTKRYEPQTKFKTWLLRVTTNVCLNELRRPEHKVDVLSLADEPAQKRPIDPPAPASASPQARLEHQELSGRLQSALMVLPDNQRAAFLMARQDNLSHEEIAGVLSTSISAVKSLIHRAVTALRKEAKRVNQEPSPQEAML